jgi:hypothetical protein
VVVSAQPIPDGNALAGAGVVVARGEALQLQCFASFAKKRRADPVSYGGLVARPAAGGAVDAAARLTYLRALFAR